MIIPMAGNNYEIRVWKSTPG